MFTFNGNGYSNENIECTYVQDNTGITNLLHEGWTCTGMSQGTTYLKFLTWVGKWVLDTHDFDTNGVFATWSKADDTGNGCPPTSGWDNGFHGYCKNFGPVDPNIPNEYTLPATTTTTTTTTPAPSREGCCEEITIGLNGAIYTCAHTKRYEATADRLDGSQLSTLAYDCIGVCNGGPNSCTIRPMCIGFNTPEWKILAGSLAENEDLLFTGFGNVGTWGAQPDNNKICPEMAPWSNNMITTCTKTFDTTPAHTNLVSGSCPNGRWSNWIDKDDPSFAADHEVIDSNVIYQNICQNPTGAEGRIVGSTETTTTQVVTMDTTGLLCLNVAQVDGCFDYEVRFCCPDPTVTDLVAGTCPNGRWSNWIDRDDPTFTADNEVIDASAIFENICENPTGAEGRIVGSTETATTQDVTMDTTGLLCLNVDQSGNCFDYEVRFCCPDPIVTDLVAGTCPNGRWSNWIDRDDPTFTADNEVIDASAIFQNICENPTGAEGRIVGSTETTTTQDVTMDTTGLLCLNADQSGNCFDYEVRFCCPDPIITDLDVGTCVNGRWSRWIDRDDPSFSGDHETKEGTNVCENPIGAQARVAGATDMTTTQTVTFDTDGLVCLNNQQTGQCFDYEVRFCCANTCEISNSVFGNVPYKEDIKRYVITNDQNVILPNAAADKAQCSRECWNTAGCFRFHFSTSGTCRIFIGESTALTISECIDTECGLATQTRIGLGTVGHLLPLLCNPIPFETQYEQTSTFNARFITRTLVEENAFLADVYRYNGITSTTPLGVWTHSTSANPQTAISQFVELQDGELANQAPTSTTPGWVWIHCRVTTFSRFGASSNSGRKRRNTFDDNLTVTLESAEAMVQKLKTELVLLAGVTLAETTETGNSLKQLDDRGTAAGTCTTGGCTCNAGFTNDEQGGCVAKGMFSNIYSNFHY